MKKIAIILNGLSGPTAPLKEIQSVCELNSDKDIDLSIYVIGAPDSLDVIIKKLIDEKFNIIVGAGGDGTLSSIAQYLINTEMIFGILPVGTLNHLAKDLNIPLELPDALSLIIKDHETISIDTAECNGKIFLNNSGIGIYPRIVELREKFQKNGHIKWRAHIYALFHVMKNIPRFFVDVNINDELISKKTSFIFIGNNTYDLGGLSTGKRETLCDGKLSLWISHRTSFLGLFVLVLHALFGNIKEHRDFEALEAEEITVATKRKTIKVSFDGEIQELKSPLRYKINPMSLKVIVPIK